MEVCDVGVEVSPRGPGRRRLRAQVVYEAGAPRGEELWFDVPERRAGDLATSGNPWLAALLPLAATLGEPLRIGLPVDRALAAGARRLLGIWTVWYPDLHPVEVEAEVGPSGEPLEDDRRVAAFFSGGADSLFTILRDRSVAPPAERAPIEELITVHGFDIPVDALESFTRLCRRHRALAQDLALDFVDVATNLRQTRWSKVHWSYLGHGAALAAVGLAMERAYSTVYIAGGGGFRGLHPWGSHSVTDPLFSTSRTAVVHDGTAWIRTEKLEAIAESPAAHWSVRVCYANDDDRNCGVCNKCLRTMVVLEICGALDRCRTFPVHPDLLSAVASMDASHFADAREIEDIRRLARARRRADAVGALDRCLRRTRRRRRLRAGRRVLAAPLRAVSAILKRPSGDL